MTEIQQQQEEEREVLLSIYDGDPAFKHLSPTTFQYKVTIFSHRVSKYIYLGILRVIYNVYHIVCFIDKGSMEKMRVQNHSYWRSLGVHHILQKNHLSTWTRFTINTCKFP